MSVLAFVAIAVYVAVIFACIAAFRVAKRQTDRPGDALHWKAGAAVFFFLAVFRLVDGENRIRAAAREMVRAAGEYETRAVFQTSMAIAILIAGLVVALLFLRSCYKVRASSRGQLVVMSRFAIVGLVALLGLRLISLHRVDVLLFGNGLHLNWLLEGAFCLIAGGCGALYAKRKRFFLW